MYRALIEVSTNGSAAGPGQRLGLSSLRIEWPAAHVGTSHGRPGLWTAEADSKDGFVADVLVWVGAVQASGYVVAVWCSNQESYNALFDAADGKFCLFCS